MKVNVIFDSFNHCNFFFCRNKSSSEKKRSGLSVNCSFRKSIHGNSLDVGIECRRSLRKLELSELPEQLWILLDMFCKPTVIWSILCLKHKHVFMLTAPKSTTKSPRLFSLPWELPHGNLNNHDLLRQCFLFSFNCEAFHSGSNLKVWL